jgi:uroporphyrinogen-III decarboxylase
MCIAGNMPVSLLQAGTPEKIEAYTKRLIEEVGEGGGFIMSCGGVMDEADIELVRAWRDYTREYGDY